MKYKLVFLLTTLLCLSLCSNNRVLQGWDDPNCSEWSDDGLICKKCSVRTYFDVQQKKCIAVSDQCETWDETNGKCLTCYDGYGDAERDGNAVDGACPIWNGTQPPYQYDVNCKCFSDDKICLECYQGYYFGQDSKCTPNPVGCKLFQNNTCTQCLAGYFLDQQGECNFLPQNCIQTDSDGACTKCEALYYLTPNGTCAELPANCAFVDQGGLCIECNEGYYLDEQGDCNFLPEFCNATDTEGRCVECEYGYFLDEEFECQFLPDNCFFTDVNGICTECADGFYLDEDKQCQPLLEFCLGANELGQCTECIDGYRIVKGECVKIRVGGNLNPDCAEQNNQSQCIKCRSFYTLQDGKCIPTGENPFCKSGSCQCGTGQCLECKQGYFLDNNNVCIAISKNCKQFSKLNGKCTSCDEQFQLIDGQCVPQKPEVICNLNCKQQTDNGTCLSCRKHYNLQDGDCVPTGQNPKCHSWSKDQVCQCCYYPKIYYLDNNNVCERRNSNCKLFNSQNGQCVVCPQNYELQEGNCVEA